MAKAISFDLSLNSTGVWTPDGEGLVLKGLDHKHTDQTRHAYLFKAFCELLTEHQPEAVFKEAIFVHPRRLNGSVQLIQVHGLLTAAVTQFNPDVVIFEVSPTALKAWATETGLDEKNGKADKAEMEKAARALGYDGPSQSDIVDAFLVRQYFDLHSF